METMQIHWNTIHTVHDTNIRLSVTGHPPPQKHFEGFVQGGHS